MKVGEVYTLRHKWLLPFDPSDFWSNCGPVVYLGEDVIHRSDGVTITNHAVLVAGETRILDHTFLRFLEPLSV